MNAEPDRVSVFRGAPATERIAARRLQLYDLGTKVGEDASTEWRGDIVPDFQHFQPDERKVAHAASVRRKKIA